MVWRLSGFVRLHRLCVALFLACAGLLVFGPWLQDEALQIAVDRFIQQNSKTYPSNVQFIESPSFPKPSGNNIKILSWTKDNITNWPLGQDLFSACKLPEGKTCEHVTDRQLYNDSEVILFHGQVMDVNDMPNYRFAHHKWLFFEIETPPQTWIQKHPLDRIRSVFNLTTTITFDSDIPMIERHRSCYVNEQKLRDLTRYQVNYARGKGSRVAWFVSHCETQSQRERYAYELSKYIPIDILGKCGNFSCGSKLDRGDCDKTIINRDYKFYLSFENSICEGYVTEKLWRLILKPITAIPIVMGSVDYKSILPEGTYLNIKDFSSPKALAEHLRKLDADDDVFNEMISKKNSLVCKHPGDLWFSEVRHHCQLCQYLHEHRDDVTQVPDILDFWSNDKRCTSAEDYYTGSFEGYSKL